MSVNGSLLASIRNCLLFCVELDAKTPCAVVAHGTLDVLSAETEDYGDVVILSCGEFNMALLPNLPVIKAARGVYLLAKSSKEHIAVSLPSKISQDEQDMWELILESNGEYTADESNAELASHLEELGVKWQERQRQEQEYKQNTAYAQKQAQEKNIVYSLSGDRSSVDKTSIPQEQQQQEQQQQHTTNSAPPDDAASSDSEDDNDVFFDASDGEDEIESTPAAMDATNKISSVVVTTPVEDIPKKANTARAVRPIVRRDPNHKKGQPARHVAKPVARVPLAVAPVLKQAPETELGDGYAGQAVRAATQGLAMAYTAQQNAQTKVVELAQDSADGYYALSDRTGKLLTSTGQHAAKLTGQSFDVMATSIVTGSERVNYVIDRSTMAATLGIRSSGAVLQSKLQPVEEPIVLSEETKRSLHEVKDISKTAVKLSESFVTGALTGVAGLSRELGHTVKDKATELGLKAPTGQKKSEQSETLKHVATQSAKMAQSAASVAERLRLSSQVLMAALQDEAVSALRYKYGDDVGAVASDASEIVYDATQATNNVKSLSTKKILNQGATGLVEALNDDL